MATHSVITHPLPDTHTHTFFVIFYTSLPACCLLAFFRLSFCPYPSWNYVHAIFIRYKINTVQ